MNLTYDNTLHFLHQVWNRELRSELGLSDDDVPQAVFQIMESFKAVMLCDPVVMLHFAARLICKQRNS